MSCVWQSDQDCVDDLRTRLYNGPNLDHQPPRPGSSGFRVRGDIDEETQRCRRHEKEGGRCQRQQGQGCSMHLSCSRRELDGERAR